MCLHPCRCGCSLGLFVPSALCPELLCSLVALLWQIDAMLWQRVPGSCQQHPTAEVADKPAGAGKVFAGRHHRWQQEVPDHT